MVAVSLSEHLIRDADTDYEAGLSQRLPGKAEPFEPSPRLPQKGLSDPEERGPHHAVAAPARRTLHVSSALALPTGLASRQSGAVLRNQLPLNWVRGGSQRSRGTQLSPVLR